MPKLMLDRQTLARLLQNDHQAIVAFEKVLGDVGDALPSTLEEVTALANAAVASANLAIELLSKMSEQLDLISYIPAQTQSVPDDVYIPAIAFGTLGQQNADAVEITGGSIDGATIGATSASTGAFTTLTASGAVALSPANANVVLSPTGTGVVTINPATLGSMDKVAIGDTTPAAAAVTTLTASAAVTLSPANAAVTLSPTGTGTVAISPATASTMNNVAIGGTTPLAGAFTTLSSSSQTLLNGVASTGTAFGTIGTGNALFKSYTGGSPGVSVGASGADYGEVGYNVDFQSTNTYKYLIADTAGSIQFAGASILLKGAASGAAGAALTLATWATVKSTGIEATPIGATTASTGRFTSAEVTTGGSTTISTGVGDIKMSSANAATNSAWIPIKYAGTTYYIPAFTTNSP